MQIFRAEELHADDVPTIRPVSPFQGSRRSEEEDAPKEHLSDPSAIPARLWDIVAAIFPREVEVPSRSTRRDMIPRVGRVNSPSLQQPPSPSGNPSAPFEAELVDYIVPMEITRDVDRTGGGMAKKRSQCCMLATLSVGLGLAIITFVLILGVGKPVAGLPNPQPTTMEDLPSVWPTQRAIDRTQLGTVVKLSTTTIQEAALVNVIQSRSIYNIRGCRASAWIGCCKIRTHDDNRIVQRFVLAVLYFSPGGPKSWNQDDGWLNSTNECEWRVDDLECNRGLVYKLHLLDCGLTGSIPKEIGLLANVVRLDLLENTVSSQFRPKLGH